ncbi:MAG: conjugal transfer protein, partial [Cryobacterium sp.]|nr:conjugal transfer protein [Cryobacterium sp.]
APATMIETIPWMNGPHAQKVRHSLAPKEPVERDPVSAPAHNPWTDGDKA